MMVKIAKIALIPLFLLVLTTAYAFAEYTTDKEKFLTEYPDLNVQDFSAAIVDPGMVVSCSSFINSETNDTCFSPGDILPDISFSAIFQNMPGGALDAGGIFAFGNNNPKKTLTTNDGGDTFRINFSERSTNVVGLQIGCFTQASCSQTVTVQSFGDQGTMIGSFDLDVSDSFDSFLGVSIPKGISAITITGMNANFVLGVDTVYFGLQINRNVPTISQWGVIATVAGLALIGFVVLRRRQKAYN